MINQITISEFHIALREEYGKKVTMEEAESILSGLTSYFDLLARLNHIIASN